MSADVDGIPLWFESSSAALMPSIEAYCSALLLSSQHRARRLTVDDAVSDVWLDNVRRLLEIWKQWWGYSPRLPAAQTRRDDDQPLAGKALLFSGGVDSFYSLHAGTRPDFLVSVQGFDIPLDDAKRMAGLESTLRQTAAAHKCQPVVVRTNLREHPSLGRPYLWERGHGGALAAIGHVLSGSVGHLLISSTYAFSRERPWGSHSQTDPLFSSSGLRVEYFGGETAREDKLAAIAFDPFVQKHLRVCWENGKPEGNCSRCSKCLVAMLLLAEHGVLEQFEVFDGANELARRVDEVPVLYQHVNVLDRAAQRGKLDSDTTRAVAALVKRSRRAAPMFKYRTGLRNIVDRYV